MMEEKIKKAFEAFDAYNSKDPNKEKWNGTEYPKEVLYAQRMSERLSQFAPEAADYIRLAARCQHIGRWEIPRNKYPMDRKGYLQWRNAEKQHHADLATRILNECGFDQNTIDIVCFLLLKKQLHTNPDTQLLEDVVCLVFIEFYLDDFAAKHDDEKIVDILEKTAKKMSPRALKVAGGLLPNEKLKGLMERALE